MKYVLGNLGALAVTVGLLLWPIWSFVEAHWAVKTLLSLLAVVGSAFFVERLLSKWVNNLITKIFKDSK
jgi:hypothetical protein